MEPLFSRAAILGLGLMGGSLGLALRATGAARTVVGYDSAPGVFERALERGAIDVFAISPEAAVASADLIVLAAPVMAERELLCAIAPHIAPGVLITDLGSTKEQVIAWAMELLPDGSHFIGGHPMAGRERCGIEAAVDGLYHNAIWCLTPTTTTNADAVASLTALIHRLGAIPLTLEPATHDRLVAGVSHLPFVAATALVRTLDTSGDWTTLSRVASGGFRDTTRLASGNPLMARDICLTNGPAITGWLDAYIEELRRWRECIAAGDGATMLADFASARTVRDAWLAHRQDTP